MGKFNGFLRVFALFFVFLLADATTKVAPALRRSLGYFVSVTDNGAHEDAARELFIVSANLFYHERKGLFS